MHSKSPNLSETFLTNNAALPLLLGTPSLQAWPSKAPPTKSGFSPWGMSSFHRSNRPKGTVYSANLQQVSA
jgi:hypothetical protein